MYRGSSFLLQKDYRVHIPVVSEILSNKYANYYDGIRRKVKGSALKNNLSETLITKILMGTLGCVPEYDRYFVTE